ncbi:MAG: carbamoyltransferase HypF, partial [Gammaproteobacteria bacterium]
GDRAAREPWRNLVAQLWHAGLDPGGLEPLAGEAHGSLRELCESGIAAPPASSTGRLFDAVAAALGICPRRQSYEGEAAMRLEALAGRAPGATPYPFGIAAGPMPVIDPAPMWPPLLTDLRAGTPAPIIARRFHEGLATVWSDVVATLAGRLGQQRVVLAGGVMQNRLLLEGLADRLLAAGLQPLIPARVPAGDGGLALGQAVIAAALDEVP